MYFDNVNDAFEAIQRKIDFLESQNQKLIKENDELKNNAYKDKELTSMRNELNEMKSEYYRGFPISEYEEKKINEWIEQHER